MLFCMLVQFNEIRQLNDGNKLKIYIIFVKKTLWTRKIVSFTRKSQEDIIRSVMYYTD